MPISALEAANAGDVATAAAAGTSAVRDILDRLDQRGRIAESAVPAPPEQVNKALAVLQTPEERAEATQPPAAYELHDRDALAILGDNFVVDARINVESTAGFFRLFRIATAPDRWLLVPRQRGQPFANVTASAEPYVPRRGADHRRQTIHRRDVGARLWRYHRRGRTDRTHGRCGVFLAPRNRRAPVTGPSCLQWGADQQVLVGTDVHPDDVEIFGKPT